MDIDNISENLGENIEKCKKGDDKAWNWIVRLYSKMIFNIAINFVGDRDTAADITQEVFIKIFNNISKFKDDRSFSAWILTICKNYCIDYWRKNRKYQNLEEITERLSGDAFTPEKILISQSETEYLRLLLLKIDPEIRIYLILRDVLSFSYQEIAEKFSIPEGTVKSRINRARSKLIELYERSF